MSRRWLLLLIVLPLVAIGALLPTLWPKAGPITITPDSGPAPRFSVPSGYHITYTITTPNSSGYTQELFVRRPFESFEQEISGGKPYLTTAMRLGEEVFRSKTGTSSLVHTALSPALRDIRLDAVASYAIQAKMLRLVGRARVLGETCYVFRSGAALNSGPLKPIGSRSYVDSCIDRRGLVVYERTTTRGKVTAERRATRIAIGSARSAADYSMDGQALAANKGGGAMQLLTLDSRPSSGPFWDIARAPARFRHVGRYVVIPSQPEAYANMTALTMSPTGFPGSLVVSIDDVYVRGANALVIEQGSTVNDATFSPPSGGKDVDLGPVLGHGQLLLSASASEVAAEPHEGNRFIRVIGTLPPDELIAIARSMTLQPPGTMRRA